ncbi:MAG: PAS domain-containing protein [Bacteroidota bacterium]
MLQSLTQKYRHIIVVATVVWVAQWALLYLGVPYAKFWIVISAGILIGWLLLSLRRLIRQYQQLQRSLAALAEGKPSADISDHPNQQVPGQEMVDKVYDKLEEATGFINTLESGEEARDLVHLAPNEHLGQALMNAQTTFADYRHQEQQRRWSAEGLAYFSEILRENTDDLELFCYRLISELVKYLGMNQGGLFTLDEEEEREPLLELQACYAYQKKRYVEKKVRLGQGLVGQCALEAKPIVLTKVPQEYVNITSGLGGAIPRFLAIVPLLFQENVKGVVEVASFQPLEEHQMTFLEKVCENIASTLTIVRGSDETQKMLDNSLKLAKELQVREEMMRDNLEELYSAQRKMEINQSELEGVLKAMDASLLVGYFSLEGKLLVANQNFAQLLGLSSQELKNREGVLAEAERKNPQLWQDLALGKTLAEDFLLKTAQREEKWINASLSAVRSPEGKVEKILLLGTDITEKKLVLEKLSLVADNTDNSVIITNKYGQIEYVNDGFVNLTGYQPKEVMWLRPGEVLQGPNTDPKTVQRISQMLRRGVAFYEEILNYTKSGKSYWISLMVNPVRNEAGEVERFISIQAEITKFKEITLDYTYKLEAISKSNAVIEFNPKGKILKANDMFLEVSGFSEKDIVGKSYEFLIPGDEKGKPQTKMMWDNLKEGTFFSGEFSMKGESGQDLWLNGTYNPTFTLEGKLHRIMMFAQFTTYEKEKQQELANTVKAFNNAVLTLEMDNEGSLKKANKPFSDVFGYKRMEISRKHLRDLLATECEIPALDNIQERPHHHLILLTSDNEEKHFFGTFTGISNLAGEQTKIILVLLETADHPKKK